ncbi:MAG: hypothetical protein IJA97_03195 [Clostridia bacterium]|nr:hypothetical protein [Clostridia bacterium]
MENLHQLSIEGRKKISATEAKEVVAFSDREIRLRLKDGSILTALGEGLKITAFDEKDGNFIAVGNVLSVKYGGGGKGFIKRVLK